MRDPILLFLALSFIVLLIVRVVRGMRVGRYLSASEPPLPCAADPEIEALLREAEDSTRIRDVVRKIELRAMSGTSAQNRAAYHCAAGHLSLKKLKRPAFAVRFYLRALGADPTCIEALDKLRDILMAQNRLKRLEWTYWNVLGRLDDAEVGSKIWVKCWSGLASVYSASARHVRRADAIRKALAAYADETEDTAEDLS